MKYKILTIMFGVVLVLAGCGLASDNTTDATTRLISGEIITAESSLVLKSANVQPAENEADCIDTVCSIRAMNTLGEGENGELTRANNRWQIRLRAGTWMIGFYNNVGELKSHLEVNGERAFRLEQGEDLDLGQMQYKNGYMIMQGDQEGLGRNGFRSALGPDCDFAELESCAAYDPTVFSIVKVRPFDGHQLVAPCRPIKIVFSQALDEATINENTIIITDADGSLVEGIFIYEEVLDQESGITEYIVKFLPSGGFELGSQITVVVPADSESILNTLGEPLAQEYNWGFTVRDFGATSVTCHDPDQEYNQEQERIRNQQQQGLEE
ncbi:MAG: Ig-like domain-containing protein [Pseudomonadota bacterium]